MIQGLHHHAVRCRDSEETRRFYEDFLGLRLAGTLEISETKMDTSSSSPPGPRLTPRRWIPPPTAPAPCSTAGRRPSADS